MAVCSTGLIGERLAMDRLLPGVVAAVAALGPDGHDAAAHAIMTTDTVAKQAAYLGDGWSLAGMAKGAGMLAPGLATMLVVLTTDAVVEPQPLDDGPAPGHLAHLRPDRLRRVHVDQRHRARCWRRGPRRSPRRPSSSPPGCWPSAPSWPAGSSPTPKAPTTTSRSSSRRRPPSTTLSRWPASVARSNLVKCAVFGNDPNWGRILAAVGTTRAAFDPQRLAVTINGIQVCRDGGVGEDRALVDLSARAVRVEIDLDAGIDTATVWTNDLTHDYVHENSAYST